jgi:hypothetical protein
MQLSTSQAGSRTCLRAYTPSWCRLRRVPRAFSHNIFASVASNEKKQPLIDAKRTAAGLASAAAAALVLAGPAAADSLTVPYKYVLHFPMCF